MDFKRTNKAHIYPCLQFKPQLNDLHREMNYNAPTALYIRFVYNQNINYVLIRFIIKKYFDADI